VPGSLQRKSDHEERTLQNTALATFTVLLLAIAVVLASVEFGRLGG
jgi:hypothetical protein